MLQHTVIPPLLDICGDRRIGTICYELSGAVRIHTAMKSEAVSCLTAWRRKNLTSYLESGIINLDVPVLSKNQCLLRDAHRLLASLRTRPRIPSGSDSGTGLPISLLIKACQNRARIESDALTSAQNGLSGSSITHYALTVWSRLKMSKPLSRKLLSYVSMT